MKKSFFLIAVMAIAGIIFLQASGNKSTNNQIPQFPSNAALVYPAAVKKVIDQKCYGCHSDKGESQDAKDALLWDKLPTLEKGDIVATLDNIIEVLEDGTMPPEDVVKKYPEAKLLSEEKDILLRWAEAKADSLLN